MNACSLNLRLKVLNAVDRSTPPKEVVRTFGVSMHTREVSEAKEGGAGVGS